MRINRLRPAAGGATAIVLASGLLGGSSATTAHAAPQAPAAGSAPCTGRTLVEKTLGNGTTWRMCWRIDTLAGLVLENVSYQPKRESKPITVLGSAALAQVNVPYDSGQNEYDDLTQIGFGGPDTLEALQPGECPGGVIKSIYMGDKAQARKALCATVQDRGYAYRAKDDEEYDDNSNVVVPGKTVHKQGKDLVVHAVGRAGWYQYINQWIFSDDGTITARAGATGDLSPFDYGKKSQGWPIGKGGSDYSGNHYHSVFWRLNFKLDGSTRARVEQYETKNTGKRSPGGTAILDTTMARVAKETAGTSSLRRWWRVVSTTGRNSDGHPRSWELVQQHSDKYDGHAYTRKDVYFTQYRACEKFASDNQDPACTGGRSVDKYVNGQNLTDPTMWVNVGFHHIPRDEDQSPMPVHWQGFQLVPRDVTAMNPLTPDDRLDHNGDHHGQAG